MGQQLPTLYVEGVDDISFVSALLARHGVKTDRGNKHLKIKSLANVDVVIDTMPDAIKQSTAHPVGFVVDIDIEITHRWDAVRSCLRRIGLSLPDRCPQEGFLGKMSDYPHQFGIWLMPDCQTDGCKLEHLVQTLIPPAHPLWPHAQQSAGTAAAMIDEANGAIEEAGRRWKRFGDTNRIKAEVRSWLAWQKDPGCALGAAVNDRILGCDSPEAMVFLRWIKRLYGFAELNV